MMDSMPDLASPRPQMEFGHERISNPEMRYFLQDQENQWTTRRRTLVRRTSDPQIDAKILKNSHLWTETSYETKSATISRFTGVYEKESR